MQIKHQWFWAKSNPVKDCLSDKDIYYYLLKCYASVMDRPNMVTIQCPHCEKDIGLEDGLVGLFDCPYCSERFSWNSGHQTHSVNTGFFDLWLGLLIPALCLYPGLKIMIAIFDPQGLDVLFFILFAILFSLSTAVILGLIGLRKQRGDLALGAGLSPIVSGIILWIYADVGF